MSDFEKRLRTLEDHDAIRELVARFADSAIRGDQESFRALWAPDGVWEIGEPFVERRHGVGAIMDLLHELRDERDFFTQLVPSGVIEIDGNNARARWPVCEVATGPGEAYYDNLAMYFDAFVRIDDTWKFSRRSYKYMWLSTDPFPGRTIAPPLEA